MNIRQLFDARVSIERNIPYMPGLADPCQTLDVYARPDAHNHPTLLFYHGGGWRSGHKRLFEHLGRAMALQGIVTIIANYRLTPQVQHPAHATDCAAAAGWAYRNVSGFGGSPDRIVLSGHSAGAHLAALIATAPQYLADAGLPPQNIRGVAAISGVYDLLAHTGGKALTSPAYIAQAFGELPQMLAQASPLCNVRTGLPPFLLLCAAGDPPNLLHQAKSFAHALRRHGNRARQATVKGRDHFSIVRRFGLNDDKTAGIIAEFVNRVTGD